MNFVEFQGVELAYVEAGSGDPTLLMIHGYGCDHEFMAPLAGYFAERHRVVSVDLRGQGASATPEQDYTFSGFADDCAFVCRALGTGPVVAVGHSMGGLVGAEMASRHPETIAGVAALDSTLIADPAALRQALPENIEDFEGPGFAQGIRRYYEELFRPLTPPGVREWVMDRIFKTPMHVLASIMRCMLTWDGGAGLSFGAPLLYVAAQRWRVDVQTLRRQFPQAELGQVVMSSHFLTLEAPGQTNAMLEDFIAKGVGSR